MFTHPSLTLVEDCSWETVLDHWEHTESTAGWEPVWRDRGFSSWREWRLSYLGELNPSNRAWKRYRLSDPHLLLKDAFGGGFKGWREYAPQGATCATFEQIASHPNVAANTKVAGILDTFPAETVLIGCTDGDRLMIFEGMHRSTAMVYAWLRQQRVLAKSIDIFLTEVPEDLFVEEITFPQDP